MTAPSHTDPSALDIVDGQLHLSLDLGEEKILASLDALGIRSVVLDEFWGMNEKMQGTPCVGFPNGAHRPLSPYAQAAALRWPERVSYLQRVDRLDPNLAAYIAVLASSPGCRALRIVLLHPAERQAFATGGYAELLSLAQSHGLPVCVLATGVGELLRVAAPAYPDLQFVLDHCGWPKTPAQWAEVLELARLPNVWLKWSHAIRPFARGEDPAAALQQAFVQAVKTFGANRVLWASDVTHEESGTSWAELLAFVRDNPALSREDKAWVLGGTARRLFGWEAEARPQSASRD